MNEITTKIYKEVDIKKNATGLMDFISKKIDAQTELHVENIKKQSVLFIKNLQENILNVFDEDEIKRKHYDLMINDKPKNLYVQIKNIKSIVSKYYQITVDEMLDKDRKRYKVLARQVAMYFAYEKTKASLTVIGKHGFNRDHSQVIYSIKVVRNMIETDKIISKEIDDLDAIISNANINRELTLTK